MKRDSFIFYTSWLDGITDFPTEIQGEICLVLLKYCAFGKVPKNMKPTVRLAFNYAKPQIDANNARYENGKKGGAPKGNKNAQKTINNQRLNSENNLKQPMVDFSKQSKTTKKQPNDNDNENVNANDVKKEYRKEKSTSDFCPPSLEEVQQYIDEKNYSIDAEAFVSFYESKGWMVGNSKMKNWRAAVTTWAKRKNNNQDYVTRDNFNNGYNSKESIIARQEMAIQATFEEADREWLRQQRCDDADFEEVSADAIY